MKAIVLTLAFAALSGAAWGTEVSAPVCRITAQKTVGSGRVLQMVVFGDSVAWGNGLKETEDQTPGHKFSALVAQWLAQTSGRRVERTVYAHSQASILPSSTDPNTGQTWPGDVDSFYPTISDQIQCVPEEQRDSVELILMTGCINDVGAFETVSPATSKRRLSKLTTKFCGIPVNAVLERTARLYPQAAIIMTGYYPIVSEQSDIDPFLDFLRQFFPNKHKHLTCKVKQQQKEAFRAKSKSAENSKLFYDLSNKLLGDAVNTVNKELGRTRLYFVKVPFSADNAFGAGRTSYLWPIPTIATPDEVYWDRWSECWSEPAFNPINLVVCDLDSAAHPNPSGAEIYADEIEKVLGSLAKQWQSEVDQAPTR
jgi:lysophospholipase L1-like esterase